MKRCRFSGVCGPEPPGNIGQTAYVAAPRQSCADAEVTFVPAAGRKFGMLYFDFASGGTPQGGMNEAGLFFDGTRTPNSPYNGINKKTSCNGNLWKRILEDCSTVNQAIDLVQR
jgi:penicillin V acylase-like amidase (Ntn superfamily)